MISAHKNRYAEAVLHRMNVRMLRRHFHALRVGGLEHLAEVDRSRPLIITPNHSCWWDGLIAFYLSRQVLRRESYLMMEERQMARYRFFRWIGAFSVVRENPREAVRSLRYAETLLHSPHRALWMYPQGAMFPNDTRPLTLYQGVGRLASRLEDVQILPAAHRYEFLMEQRPVALTLFGSVIRISQPVDHRDVTAHLQGIMTELLDQLRCSIPGGTLNGFATVFEGRASTNRLYDLARGVRQ